jgi:hypothetical protein
MTPAALSQRTRTGSLRDLGGFLASAELLDALADEWRLNFRSTASICSPNAPVEGGDLIPQARD